IAIPPAAIPAQGEIRPAPTPAPPRTARRRWRATDRQGEVPAGRSVRLVLQPGQTLELPRPTDQEPSRHSAKLWPAAGPRRGPPLAVRAERLRWEQQPAQPEPGRSPDRAERRPRSAGNWRSEGGDRSEPTPLRGGRRNRPRRPASGRQ